MEFSARPRLVWHLQHSKPQCLQAYKEFFEPLGAEEAEMLDEEDRFAARALRRAGEHRCIARLPAARVQGPCIRPARMQAEAAAAAPPVAAQAEVGIAAEPLLLFAQPVAYYVQKFLRGATTTG